jgi:hypothetical protein
MIGKTYLSPAGVRETRRERLERRLKGRSPSPPIAPEYADALARAKIIRTKTIRVRAPAER